jgi:NAD(P)H-hydrate epimerase
MLINLILELPVVEFITPQQMIEEEKRAFARGITVETLMENAGRGVAEEVNRRFAPLEGKMVAVLAGNGNNGGDGMVAARYLSSMDASCLVILLGTHSSIKTEEARKNLERLFGTPVKTYDVTAVSEMSEFFEAIESADIVLDAIFGTGVRGAIRELHAEAIRTINRSKGAVVSVDIPSGLDPLTGKVGYPCVKADLTITLHRAKVGLRQKEEYTGELVVVPIGID